MLEILVLETICMFSGVQICGFQRQQASMKLRGGHPFMFSNISLSGNKLVPKYLSLGGVV